MRERGGEIEGQRERERERAGAMTNNEISVTEYESLFAKYLKRDDWYVWVNMKSGGVTLPIFQSLEAFWPGLQVSCLSLPIITVASLVSIASQFPVFLHDACCFDAMKGWGYG